MAMIKCKECGSNVSSKALNCPNCGNPVRHKIDIVRTIGTGLILMLFITFLIGLCENPKGKRKASYSDNNAVQAKNANNTVAMTPDSTGLYVTKYGYFGAIRKESFEKAVKYMSQNDRIALQRLYDSYEIFTLKNGVEVYLEDTSIFTGKVQLRIKGTDTTFWTFMEAIEEKYPDQISMRTQIQNKKVKFDIIDLNDISGATGIKRFKALALIDKSYTKDEIKIVLREATEYIKKRVDADIVWLLCYYNMEDKKDDLWAYRSEWIKKGLPKDRLPIPEKGDDRIGDIEITWNKDYDMMKEAFKDFDENGNYIGQ